jgi:hypothetical protein
MLLFSLINRKSFLPPEEGPSIYVDADLLNILMGIQRTRDHNYLSLLTARSENNRSASSLINVDGETKNQRRNDKHRLNQEVSSCPSKWIRIREQRNYTIIIQSQYNSITSSRKTI